MKRLTVFKAAFASAVSLPLCMTSVTATGDDPKMDIVLNKVTPTGRGIVSGSRQDRPAGECNVPNLPDGRKSEAA